MPVGIEPYGLLKGPFMAELAADVEPATFVVTSVVAQW